MVAFEQKDTSYSPTLLIQHNSLEPDQDKAVADTLEAIENQSKVSPVLAILPGAETGVLLADM